MLQQYKILAFLALIVSSYGLGHYNGKTKEVKRQQQEILAATVKQQEATVKTVTEYVDKIKVVKERGDVIVKKIPVYITKEIDNGCVIPDSFSLLWNASNSGEAP
jgi:Tfp pilus assembly protein PilO